MQKNSHFPIGIVIAAVVIFLDQLSKWAIVSFLFIEQRVTWFFNLILAFNKGVSFSMLSGGAPSTRWMLIGLSLSITALLVYWLIQKQSKLSTTGLGLIIGGAIGNVIDRFVYGAVVDFLQFHYNEYYFPTFNIADAAITIGVGLLILDTLLEKKDSNA
ncbi:MAG: signal peptidase II [Alphaproteobacteria bacterium]